MGQTASTHRLWLDRSKLGDVGWVVVVEVLQMDCSQRSCKTKNVRLSFGEGSGARATRKKIGEGFSYCRPPQKHYLHGDFTGYTHCLPPPRSLC